MTEQSIEKPKIKVLWLGRKDSDYNSSSIPSLRTRLAELTEMQCRETFTAPEDIKCDIVIIGPIRADLTKYGALEYWQKNIPRIMLCSDPQSDLPQHKVWIENFHVNLALLTYGDWIKTYKEHLNCEIDWLPWSLENLYTNTYKDIQLAYAIADGPEYPIRQLMQNDERLWQFSRIMFGISSHRLSQNDYLKVLNRSKMLAFDNSIWNFFILKWLEGFSTKNLVLAPTPLMAEELHLKAYENYVPISPTDYYDKIVQYSNDNEQRVRITNKGHEMFLQYHTSEVRAKELLEKIQRLLRIA